ncbi:MAG TPA: hypothetical protein VFN88_00755, partial [Caulobacteraceae bacterium]|nr:hypothetical protein [Caulobacteraceae bacterium]
ATIADEYEALPVNYLSVQSIALVTDPVRPLRFVDAETLLRMKADEAAWRANRALETGADPAPPAVYAIVGTELRFFPPPQAQYVCALTVFERLDRLTADNDSNWLLETFPHLYLYGSALHSAPYLGADERLATWQGLYEAGVEKLMASDPEPTSKAALRSEVTALVGKPAEAA